MKALMFAGTCNTPDSSSSVPEDYVCSVCYSTNIRLYKTISFSPLDGVKCAKCTAIEQGIDLDNMDSNGCFESKSRFHKNGKTYDIGKNYVPAVPRDNNNGYYLAYSYPEEKFNWWLNLPVFKKD